MKVKKSELFELLNQWRAEGLMNMMEGPYYISKLYGIDKQQAREVCLHWTKVFNRAGDYSKYNDEIEVKEEKE